MKSPVPNDYLTGVPVNRNKPACATPSAHIPSKSDCDKKPRQVSEAELELALILLESAMDLLASKRVFDQALP